MRRAIGEIDVPRVVRVPSDGAARPVIARAVKHWIDGRADSGYYDVQQFIFQRCPPVVMAAQYQVCTILASIGPVPRYSVIGLLPHEPGFIVRNRTIPIIHIPAGRGYRRYAVGWT